MNARAEVALAYHEDGLALLPLGARSKEPNAQVLRTVYSSTSTRHLLDRRASRGEILQWFETDPESNVGVVTGPSKLVVVDFDQEVEGLRLPVTPTVRTMRGVQLYLREDAQIKSKNLSWGEIRCGRLYVVAPPSVHPSGIEYTWAIAPAGRANGSTPEADLAPASDFLAQLDERGLLEGDSRPGLDPVAGTGHGLTEDQHSPTYEGLCSVQASSGLLAFVRDHRYVVAACSLLGIPHSAVASIGKTFRCVLPGHEEHHPSASLFVDPKDDVVVYRDWHRGGHFYALADVYAAQVSGRVQRLNGPSRAQWTRRLLIETGLLDAAPVSLAPLPVDAPNSARAIYDGYAKLLACRWQTQPGEPAPFALDFARDWCGGISAWQVGAGKAWLIENGYLQKAGVHERATLWLPGDGRLP